MTHTVNEKREHKVVDVQVTDLLNPRTQGAAAGLILFAQRGNDVSQQMAQFPPRTLALVLQEPKAKTLKTSVFAVAQGNMRSRALHGSKRAEQDWFTFSALYADWKKSLPQARKH